MTDVIVYTVVTKGGGQDGRDHTDKGGKVMACYPTREAIPAKYSNANSGWYDVVPVVADLKQVAAKALAKLDALESYALNSVIADAAKAGYTTKR